MAYDPHTWNTQEPITKAKMQHIEDGIAALDTQQTTNTNDISSIKSQVGTINTTSGGSISQRLSNISNDITILQGQVGSESSLGPRVEAVEGQINNARTVFPNPNDPSDNSLQKNLQNLKAQSEGIDAAYKAADTELSGRITTAQSTADTAIGAINTAKGTADSLAQRLNNIETKNSTQDTAISNINDRLNAPISGDSKNLEQHISNINSHISDLESEIETARGTDSLNVARQNLNARFVDNEARIAAAEGRLTTVETATTSTIPNRISNTEGRINTVEGKVTEITNAHRDENDTLDMRFDDIESELTGVKDTYNSIDARFDAVEATANAAATSSDVNNIDSRLQTIEGNVNNATTGLAAAYTLAAAAATASDLTTLAGRVTSLENNPVSATIVVEQVTYNNNGIPTSIASPSADVDYLLKKDDKYYYWKYINNTWQLIGGGESGGGTSSAEFYAALTDITGTPSETVDYFIGSGTNYIHYRYYNNQWVQILPAHLINSVSVDTDAVSAEENAPTKSRPIIKEIGSNTNLLADFMAIKSIAYENTENGTKLIWTDIDGSVQDVTISGGGGGQGSNATATITRITASETNGTLTTISGESCPISFSYTATDNSGDTVATSGTATWSINRAQVATSTVNIGTNTFDITPYLHTGDNNITLKVDITIDDQVISRTKTWAITVVNFSLVWDYDESTINDDSTIIFSFTPYGVDITKTLHLQVGSNEYTQTITTSGIPTTITIDNDFEHGNYTAGMWMTATINGAEKTTDHISHDFIVVEPDNNTPIIAATLPSNSMNQYDTITIPFVVYTPNFSTSTVTLAVDGIVQDTRDNVGRTTQTWNYTPLTSGTKVLTITSGSVTKTLNLIVNSININNSEIGGYTFKLKASELPSNNALRAWCYDSNHPTTTALQFSNNFNWVNGGIQTEQDENGQLRQYIRVKSGTTMTIPYKMFETDPRTNGANFKIIFKIDNCRDYDATVATNVAENIGIQLNAHKATFKSTTTEISTQYGEEEYTELEFEVYKALTSNGTEASNPYMMAWVDGVMTTARPYGGNFVQTAANAANFVIGSNDCDICIYLVKYYPTVLSINDHITNFIADAPNAVEMIKRYNRNDILDADEDIDYNKLAQKNPDCRVWLYDIDRMTKAKDDPVTVHNFQQIWSGGDQYYQLQGTNAKMKIQGTSSVNYRYGAANTDIDFGKKKAPDATLVDGYGNNLLSDLLEYKGFKIHDDSLPITYSNTKVNFASCEQVNNMCNAEWYQRYQPFPSLSARDCMEFAMGVQFIKDRRNDEPVDGITLFTEKGADFNPEKYYMYSIANMGTSKKNTHIFHSDDELCIEIKENTTDAQKMKSFDSDWVLPDHTGNYEIRYPDIKPADFTEEMKDGWERFVTWMVANNPGAATGNALAESVTFEPYTFRGHNREVTNIEGRHFEQVLRGVTIAQYAGTYTHDTFEYRMAKMLSECEDYMAMDSVVYHFCFIERHTMVDNVAKNTFWSSVKEVGGPNNEEGYWIWDLSKNYDNDTSDGNNNNGLLVFDYGNEATDTRDGTPVFNGNDAVWFVFVSNLYDACRAMFTNRENIGAWSSSAYHAYLLGEQQKVPERVWNECYWYDYLRTYENNVETTWINFLDGGQKTHQRKHYETYEEIYDSSKYRGSLSHNQSITLRGEAIDYQTLGLPAQESKFTVTMFNKCYLTIWIGTNHKTEKCAKGVPVTINFYEDDDPSKGYMSLANSVIDIDSGSMVQAIGDLSRIYPSSGQFGAAKRLRSLQIGSDTQGYYNPNMNTNSILTFNNKMLEYLYVQNLPQATYNLDLSGCPELKLLNAAGSGFTGFVFANGGLLNEAHINAPTSLVMRNLNALTKANFYVTNPTAITSLRLENCSQFDNQTFLTELTNLGVLRLTNINWSLNNGTLLDRLVNLMGINESGYTISQSYLSGTVSLNGTVYEGVYNTYVNAWAPDLTIDVSQASFIHQHLVTFYNEDGTKLYEQYINSGDQLIDPFVNNLLDGTPAKAADVQYQYIFGELDFAENYIPFSGWRISSESQSIYQTYGSSPNLPVNGAMNLIAVYSTTPQRYTVRWLLSANQVVSTTDSPQNYGGGYNLVSPTIKEVQDAGYATYSFTASGNTCSYRIMTGWDKLPTNITPTVVGQTYDIYATWLERSNVNYQTVLTSSEYSVEEKLLVLKEMSTARDSLSLADKFQVRLGYDGLKPAANLVSNPIRYIGTPTVINDYTPFATNKNFTMAIDYRFEFVQNNLKDEAVLLSCYDNTNNSVQGFKLFYDPKSASPVPQISFGSTAQQSSSNIQTINSTINNRGIVVLRHRAGENTLYIYTGSNNSGLSNTYSSSNFRKTVTWSSNASNAKIVLGGINVTDASIMNATGTLYSVKYWEEDLGEGECLQLANWCHETINFAVSDYREAEWHSAINDTLTSAVVLHTLNASEMGTIIEPQIDFANTPTIGWDPSTVRTFYNNRLYYALPIKLQSIINPVSIAHRKAYKTNEGAYVIANAGTNVTQDYVFALSCIEVGATGATITNHNIEATNTFSWSTSQMVIKRYNNGIFENASGSISYTNLRFPYYLNSLNNTVTVYINYPQTGSSFYQWAQSNSITLHAGDILIPYDSSEAYIYVPATEVNKGAPIVNSTESYLSNTSGGWIKSIGWWTRSVPDENSNRNAAKFLYLNNVGVLTAGTIKTQGLVYSIAL